jgi:hypothetical protein
MSKARHPEAAGQATHKAEPVQPSQAGFYFTTPRACRTLPVPISSTARQTLHSGAGDRRRSAGHTEERRAGFGSATVGDACRSGRHPQTSRLTERPSKHHERADCGAVWPFRSSVRDRRKWPNANKINVMHPTSWSDRDSRSMQRWRSIESDQPQRAPLLELTSGCLIN